MNFNFFRELCKRFVDRYLFRLIMNQLFNDTCIKKLLRSDIQSFKCHLL